MIEQLPDEIVREAFQQPYQYRSKNDHAIVLKLLGQAFANLEPKQAMVLSLFAELVPRESTDFEESCKISGVFLQRAEDGRYRSIEVKQARDIEEIDFTKLTIFISAEGLARSRSITNIEEEIRFLRNCGCFAQLPKKALYQVLRHADIVAYAFGQPVYKEGDYVALNQRPVFLVKTGQFSFKKSINLQTVSLYEFGKGYLFGDQELAGKNPQSTRMFTVACVSSQGVLFKLSSQFYDSFLRTACNAAMCASRQNLASFLNERIQKVLQARERNSQLIGLTSFRRSLSVQGTFLTAAHLLDRSSLTQTTQLPERKSTLPLVNRGFKSTGKQTLNLQTKDNVNPEYQELLMMHRKKEKCERVRVMLNAKQVGSRGEILLGLLKGSWQRQRDKAKGRRH